MTSWLPTLFTIIGGLTASFSPVVQAYVAGHPKASVGVAIAWALFKGLVPSPIK